MSVHRAIRATGLATGVSFVLGLTSSIIVARLLTPTEIGIFSIAVSLLAFGHVLRDFGVGQYVGKLREVTRDDMRAAFSVMLITSWTVAALMIMLAPQAAQFYHQPGIASVFYVMAGSFAVLPFGSHILSMLKREMAFDTVAFISISAALVQTSVTLICAWLGGSYMSMAWGSLAGNVTTVLCLFAARPALALLPPTIKRLAPVLQFGGTASVASLIGRMGESGPDLVLGKTLSIDAVAHFSRANSPLTMVSAKVNEVLIQVFGPAFAKGLREDQPAAPMLARAIEAHTGMQIPLVLLLAVVSRPMILLMFGEQWHVAADIAPWVTLWSVLVAPIQLAHGALMAGGHARAFLRASITCNVALLLVLMLSLRLDLQEVCMALLLFRLVTLWAWARELSIHYAFGVQALWTACRSSVWLGLITAVPAVVVAWVVQHRFGHQFLMMQLLLIGGVGCGVYVVGIRLLSHPLREELVRLLPPLKRILGEPRAFPASAPEH